MNKKTIGAFFVLAFFVGCGTQQGDNDTEKNNEVAQPSENAITYDCQGEEIKADFNNDVEPRTVSLFIVNKNTNITLPNVESGSGAKYSDNEFVFWTHQDEATLSIKDTDKNITCTLVN